MTLYQTLDNINWNKTRDLIPTYYTEYKQALLKDDKDAISSLTATIKAQGGDPQLFSAFI